MVSTGAEQVWRVDAVLDLAAARALQVALSGASAGAVICLDFTGVRAFEDAALSVLAVGLRGCRAARVAVRGLGRHQARLMRYLGLDLRPWPATA
jgi:anti-anti-sigma regulatory factor